MIVTIDGPAGAGKSSASRKLAERLGFRFLDTGAMYRAIALAALNEGLDLSQPELLVELARRSRVDALGGRVLLNGEDVSREIRSQRVTQNTFYAANNPGVRAHLVALQRELVTGQHVVTEGRDQGSAVFPQADCKIYLTASPEERARRRLRDILARGETATLDEVLAEQSLRDQRDAGRDVGPLVRPSDAIDVWTDGLTEEQVVDHLEAHVRRRMAELYVD